MQDQFENIAQHTQHGIDFCDRLGNFLKERCSIENEYAAKLKYVPRLLHIHDVNTYLTSYERLGGEIKYDDFWSATVTNVVNCIFSKW